MAHSPRLSNKLSVLKDFVLLIQVELLELQVWWNQVKQPQRSVLINLD